MFQTSLFADPIEDLFNDILLKDLKRGTGFENGKERVRSIFANIGTKADRCEAIKAEYGIGGLGNGDYWQFHDAKGLTIELPDVEEKLYTWQEIHDCLDVLIHTGNY